LGKFYRTEQPLFTISTTNKKTLKEQEQKANIISPKMGAYITVMSKTALTG
jgi:hypothetical protein